MDATEKEQLEARLLAKLQPERIRSTIAFAGHYQLTYELIKTTVIENLRNFYT